MIAAGIILLLITGFSLTLRISRTFNLSEYIGYSVLSGIGVSTYFMFLADILHIPITASVLSVFMLVTAIGLLISIPDKKGAIELFIGKRKEGIKSIEIAAVAVMLILGWLAYVISVKCLFWPPAEHDTIGSFDKLGKVIAIEGKLKVSLFDFHVEGAGGVYPPLLHGSYAFAYLFGAETSKIMNTLFYTGLIFSFFGVMQRVTNQTLASIYTLVFAVTPELYAHAALTLGNMPSAAYSGIAIIALGIWVKQKREDYFWISALMMGLTFWIRGDTIVFAAGAMVLLIPAFLNKERIAKAALYTGIIILPFIAWNLYLKFVLHAGQLGRFNLGIGYNEVKFDIMWGYLNAMLLGKAFGKIDGGQLYGLTFYLMYFSLILSGIWLGVKKKLPALVDVVPFLSFVITLAAYFMVFYLLDEKLQASPIDSLMSSSFKRGMFCFLPFALYVAADSIINRKLRDWLDAFIRS